MCVDEYLDKSSHAFPCLAGCISYVSSCIAGKLTQWKQKHFLSTKKQAPQFVKWVKLLKAEVSCLWEAIWADLISALHRFQNSAMGGICTCKLNTRVNQKNCSFVCVIAGTIKIIRERGVQRAVHNSVFHPLKPFEMCSPNFLKMMTYCSLRYTKLYCPAFNL